MKIRVVTVFLLVLFLSGCSASAMGERIDAAGQTLQERAADMEDTLKEVLPDRTAGITREQAQAIALKHAGFTAEQITGLRVEQETDDGVPVYEVTFRQGPWEFDYEISAQTGEILSWDRDR